MLPTKFRFIWPSGFREDFFRNRPFRSKNCLWRPCLLTGQDKMCNLYRGPSKDASYQVLVHLDKWFQRITFFQKLTNQKQELPMVNQCFLTNLHEISNLYRGPSIEVSYQVSIHLANRFQRKRFFRNRPIKNKNCLWWPYLLTYRDTMCSLYRGPFIDASFQVSVHLAKRFQRRRFVEIGQSETRISCGGHVC